jgi:hypothetical protein
MVSYFPLISGIISAVFTILLATQYIRRRKAYQLMWTVALALFTLAYALEFSSELYGWTEAAYQVYYASVSPLVALMGVGTLFLLARKSLGKYFLAYTLLVSTVLVILVSTASIDKTALAMSSGTSGTAMPSYVRLISPLLTIPGSLILIIGAFYSFWLDKSRKHVLLIASGGTIYSLSGYMARLGELTYVSILQAVGILLLFLGFLLSTESVRTREKHEQPSRKTETNEVIPYLSPHSSGNFCCF